MIFAAFAAALALSASCNKEVSNDAPGQTALRTVTFNALPTETKTIFGDKTGSKYPVLWQEGDKINYTFNFGDIPTTPLAVTPSADGTTASFSGSFEEAESYQFIFVGPAEAFKSRNKSNGTIMVEFPSGQTSTAASPDPSAQILYANTGEITTLPESLEVNFSHLAAYLHLQFSNVALGDAVVQAVNITSDDYYIAGRLFYKFNDGVFEDSTSSMFHTIAVATTTLNDVWCALRPVDLSGKSLTVVVSTDKGTLTKTVNMPSSAALTGGRIGKFTVDMTGVVMESPVIYKAVTNANQLHIGDKVIIAAADVEQAFAMSTGQNTNNRSQAGVTKTLTEITNPSDEVEIIKLEDGVIPGHFALKATGAANSGYLYAASLDGAYNYLRTQANININASWAISIETITIEDVTTENAAVIVADSPAPASNVIRHNPGSVLFSAYQPTSKQKAVMLYRLDEPADETPRFNATLPGGSSVNSEAHSVTIYVFSNVAWTASVSGEGASLNETSGTGNAILTLSVPENTDTENTKSYSVTVSTTAAVSTPSIVLTITQSKKPDASGIKVGTVLFHEQYWTGGVDNQTVAQYNASGDASTVVYGGASVTYTSDASSKLMKWTNGGSVGNVFLPTSYSGALSTDDIAVNLRLQKNGGWWKIADVPCIGVKKATLTYKLNRSGLSYYTPSTETTGVTFTDGASTSGTSDWGKAYNEYTYTVNFTNTLSKFDFKINDTHSSNHVYIADVKVVVTEMY